MRTIPLTDAEPKELRQYAKTVLGLDGIENYHNKQQLTSKILAASPGLTAIELPDAPDSPAADAAAERSRLIESTPVLPESVKALPEGLSERQRAQYRYDPLVKVFIASVPGPGGDRHVDVAVNNDVVRIKRDEWVPVPYRFYLALKDAIATELTPKNDETTGRLEILRRDVHSYPFNVDPSTLPTEAQIADWEARVGHVVLA